MNLQNSNKYLFDNIARDLDRRLRSIEDPTDGISFILESMLRVFNLGRQIGKCEVYNDRKKEIN